MTRPLIATLAVVVISGSLAQVVQSAPGQGAGSGAEAGRRFDQDSAKAEKNQSAEAPAEVQTGRARLPKLVEPGAGDEEMVSNGPAPPYETMRAHLRTTVGNRVFELHEPISWIGSLTGTQCAAELALTKEQATQISRFDRLARRVLIRLANEALTFLDQRPQVRRQSFQRNEQLERDVREHAQAIVPLGFLTTSQAALLRQWRCRTLGINALQDADIVRYLRLTNEQRKELGRRFARVEANARTRMTHRFPSGPEGSREFEAQEAADRQMIWEVLDPVQAADWGEVTDQEIIPSGPNDSRNSRQLTAAQKRRLEETEAEAKQFKMRPPSRIFQALIDPATATHLKLTNEQTEMLKELDEIVRDTLVSLALRGANAAATAKGARAKRREQTAVEQRRSLVEHCEQVALLGVLSGAQTERLKNILDQK